MSDSISRAEKETADNKLRAAKKAAGRAGRHPLKRRSDPDAPAPLSYGQQRLWFLQQLNPENLAYNTSRSLYIHGPLDVSALRKAFSAVVARHEILRTTYETRNGQPVQIVQPAEAFPLPLQDMRAIPKAERLAAIQKQVRNEIARPFNLSKEIPLRAWLYRMETDEYILVRENHHIASDLWSNGIFNRELADYYTAFNQGRSLELPALPVQ